MTEWKQNGFIISTNKNQLDIDTIFHFLCNDSYWAKGVSRQTVEKSINNSMLCFGIYKEGLNESWEQVGFARVITDLTTLAYLCDVFILPAYRGLGLSKWLVKTIINYPELQGVRRFMLATFDAHSLYSKFGFEQLDTPERFMQITGNKIGVPAETEN
ncbi:GNAT family N-acetyltransferase [Peribacillus glennii]|uniref:N-acetyltransferase n=1 Tax=Peribacillus glennii TaxID=2303991 RepID=A0A372LI28_9BACI|nr:GNAT family N-acetyltransferase [Peribacillus glennii]RFU65276.1 N-acetyltransferase [Peribacillus glennii]